MASVSTFLALSSLSSLTTIAAGSNAATLPQATINVVATGAANGYAAFPNSGTIYVTTSNGIQTVTYTGITGTTFTGCSGGTGSMSTGGVVSLGALAKTYTNATPSNLGSRFGHCDNVTNGSELVTTLTLRDSIIAYEGYRTFFAITGGVIYKSTDGGTTWTANHTLSGVLTSNAQGLHSGLRVSSRGGTSVLFIMYADSATSNWYVDYSTDGGGSWSTTGAVSILSWASTSLYFSDFHFYQGKFFATAYNTSSGGSVSGIFDPSSKVLSAVGLGQYLTRLCVYNGNLYALSSNSTSGADIYQYTGTWTRVKAAFRTGLNSTAQRWELFEHGGFMYALSWLSTSVWACTRFDTSLNTTVLDGLIPQIGSTGQFLAVVDSAQNTGTEPNLYLYAATSIGNTGWTCYKWMAETASTTIAAGSNGATLPQATINVASTAGFPTSGSIAVQTTAGNSLVTYTGVTGTSFTGCAGGSSTLSTGNTVQPSAQVVEAGGSAAESLAIQKWSGGEGWWQSGTNKIDLLTQVGVPSGVQFTFKVYSPSGTANVSLRAWFATSTGVYPITACTLTNNSAGSLSSDHKSVTGLTADGSTTYTCTWSSGTDGINAGDAYQLLLEQF